MVVSSRVIGITTCVKVVAMNASPMATVTKAVIIRASPTVMECIPGVQGPEKYTRVSGTWERSRGLASGLIVTETATLGSGVIPRDMGKGFMSRKTEIGMKDSGLTTINTEKDMRSTVTEIPTLEIFLAENFMERAVSTGLTEASMRGTSKTVLSMVKVNGSSLEMTQHRIHMRGHTS